MTFSLLREETVDGDQLSAMLVQNPVRAAQAILRAAKANFVDAQALLGQILLDGNGIERDPELAVTWFQIAARNGHVMAQNMLGRCHEHGWGCCASPLKAAAYYQAAADAGLDWGLYNLGNLLATGRGVTQDQQRALACYRQAAEWGHAKSMNLVGRYLEEGCVCPVDLPAAHEWYRCSAEGGDFRGQFSHAAILADNGKVDEALHWLSIALENGNLNFLRVSSTTLSGAAHSEIRALAVKYRERITARENSLKAHN
ncbi:tetratricopeptide repeat protein [Pseudomonas sp. RTB3]|uniref:tetratricopeptide repeat protein n=1 Tax=unclassified Pseudomonas TaxID=196821 RepID=UPI002B22FA1A|nr:MULTISPECIES: tetratricopeptide repeat protein [unclassified Pseudomonas]MEB0009571.1 tetratricopeptide repeat protein [Pseudomonas sp. RTB2]MEB0017600.1 tetratricopeptide repeat protein [Pseudomonas sp. RTB3]MEB0272438.1 tetratricopeptide repeat protein [Pseudomonas sp. 5B4]